MSASKAKGTLLLLFFKPIVLHTINYLSKMSYSAESFLLHRLKVKKSSKLKGRS